MLAIRRAANPLRSHFYRIVVTHACCGNPGVPISKSECVNGLSVVLKPFSHGSSFCLMMPSWGSRNLSSHAGMKSSDSENDLDDGFSDLDRPPSTDRIEDIGHKEDDCDLVSESDASEEDFAEDGENLVGLSGTDTDANGEKAAKDKNASPLFKIIMDAPHSSVDSALDKWVEEGNALGRGEIAVVMLNLRKRRLYVKALEFVTWLKANKRLEFAERDYASYLDIIAKVRGLQNAEKYIEKIPTSFRGEIIYRTLLANCVASTNVKKAEEVYNKIRELGLPITTFTCNQLLLLYKRVNRKKIGDVLLMMEKENIKPTRFTYKLLIDSKGRSNDISGMEQIVDAMKAEGIDPDMTIQAMIAKHYMFAGLNEKAESVVKEIEGSEINKNRNSCKVLLPLYAALGKTEDVTRIWKVCEADPRPDERLAAIEAWGELGHVENAEKIFDDMMKTSKKLSSNYYNALLNVYASQKLLSKGKELAKRMSDNGCRIGPLTWDVLVRMYAESGEVEKAELILEKAAKQRSKIRPLYNSYMILLDRYAKEGDVHNAEKIFLRLRQIGYVGRMRQYQSLLQAYVNAKTPAYGFRERLKADNIMPNKAFAAQIASSDAFRKTQISELLD
ncbi:TPR-like protein [Dioscorea alata]|uniref:TPR-like protein n=1 Tax=Dioscorea alata TaxID=55571 RepID=A0ACB7V2A0_DIOAL|nr:TPR-like protein [Dioscorea alata]